MSSKKELFGIITKLSCNKKNFFSENLLATERKNNKYSIIYRFWHDYMEPKYEKSNTSKTISDDYRQLYNV